MNALVCKILMLLIGIDYIYVLCKCYCFREFFRKLAELGLLEPMVGQVLTSLIYSYIESHIQKICKDSFDVSYIKSLQKVIVITLLSVKNYI